jgi:hypothetical protein
MNDYQIIEVELQRRREQVDSVRGKYTPYRVEFRYPGVRHYQYFVSAEDAALAEDSICGYGPTGRAFVQKPSSQQIQFQGPHGGWRKHQ